MHLSVAQRRVLSATIELCRTAALGGHVDVDGAHCGYEHPGTATCRNRHCPNARRYSRRSGLVRARSGSCPSSTFTWCSRFRASSVDLQKPIRAKSSMLFHALASETLLALGHSRLRATLGITMVLRTWTRKLDFIPHACMGLRPVASTPTLRNGRRRAGLSCFP